MYRLCLTITMATALLFTGCIRVSQPNPPSEPTPNPQEPGHKATPPRKPEPKPENSKPSRLSLAERKKLKRSYIKAKFLKLEERERRGKTSYRVHVELNNVTGKDIKSYKGSIRIQTQEGKTLVLFGTIDKDMKAGANKKTSFPAPFLKPDEAALIKENPKQIQAFVEIRHIQFADGTEQEF